jgi:glucuronate isomerase
MAFMTRGHYMFQLMTSNGLVALLISGEKYRKKLFPFLVLFLQECVGHTFAMSTIY